MERQDDSNPAIEALKRGGLQGLLAVVPVTVWLHGKQTDAVTKVLSEMDDTELTGLRKATSARAMLQSANKLAMKEPMVLGATIVASSMGHGAWRGYHKAQHAAHKSADSSASSSYKEREDRRREASRQASPAM